MFEQTYYYRYMKITDKKKTFFNFYFRRINLFEAFNKHFELQNKFITVDNMRQVESGIDKAIKNLYPEIDFKSDAYLNDVTTGMIEFSDLVFLVSVKKKSRIKKSA